jgi:excisionase family DNA binding protein
MKVKAGPGVRLYTVREVAEICRLSEAMIWQLVGSKRLESIKIGAARRIPADALDQFIKSLRGEQAEDGAA